MDPMGIEVLIASVDGRHLVREKGRNDIENGQVVQDA